MKKTIVAAAVGTLLTTGAFAQNVTLAGLVDVFAGSIQYSGDKRTAKVDSNGMTTKFSYDTADRLTTRVEQVTGGNNVLTIVDTYDSVGNRTKRNQDGTITTWSYDAANRLVSQLGSARNV